MPVANCLIRKSLYRTSPLLEGWLSAGHRSLASALTIVAAGGQQGKRYDVIADLYLPSLWTEVDIAEVLVMTQVLESGSVVEAGEVARW